MNKTTVKYPFLSKDVEIYERENGHKIVLAHKEGGLVNISTWVRTGSINENENNNGISHFLEHLMFKGTHKHPAGEFDRILEAKGAIVNAATWKDYTFYYVTLPKGENNEDFNLALELHADMMIDPVLPYDEIGAPFDLNDKNIGTKRERHVVIEEIRMREDQPWTKVYNACNRSMYTSHPYKRDVIGTPQIISQVKQEEAIFNIVDSEHYIFRDGGNFFIQANFSPDKKDIAIDLIKNEIEAVKTTISDDELNKAKKKIKSRFASNAETVSEIGENIGYYMTVCNDLSLVTDYLGIVEDIKVCDLQDAAKQFLNINNATISVLLPEE